MYITNYQDVKDVDVVRRVVHARLERGESLDFVPCLGGIKSNMRMTMLHWAVWYRAEASVRVLVNAGASVEAKDICGKTPLDLALEQKVPREIADLLSQPRTRRPVTLHTVIPD